MMIKIAVIDSGLTSDYRERFLPHVSVSGCHFVTVGGIIQRVEEEYEDKLGHGTACVSIIDRRIKNIDYHIVNIFNDDGRTNSSLLITAFEYLLNIDLNIICVSLVTHSEKYIKEMRDVCDALVSQNKIIVASCGNTDGGGYPAIFPNVFGVDRKHISKIDSYYFYPNQPIQIVCDGYPEEIFGSQLLLLGGSSKAAAVFCSIISKQMATLPSGEDIHKSILYNAETIEFHD